MYIYKLNFSTGDFYIGKTTGQLSIRLQKHINRLKLGTHHNKKMQKLFNIIKEIPNIEIIEKVSSHNIINDREKYWIKQFNATQNGLNLTEGGDGPAFGEYNHQAKYTLEDYKAIVVFLAKTDMSLREIAKELEVSLKVVEHISCGESHHYLKELLPEEYELMIKRKGTRKHPERYYEYPDFISPKGKIYTVSNLCRFALEHDLDPSSLSKLVKGKAKSVKGWKLCPQD